MKTKKGTPKAKAPSKAAKVVAFKPRKAKAPHPFNNGKRAVINKYDELITKAKRAGDTSAMAKLSMEKNKALNKAIAGYHEAAVEEKAA